MCECEDVLFRLKGSACFPSPLGLGRCKAPCLLGGTTVSSSSSCSSCCAAECHWWSLPLTLSPGNNRSRRRLITIRVNLRHGVHIINYSVIYAVHTALWCGKPTWLKERVPFRCLQMLGGWMFWNTAERGRLERFGRGLLLADSADTSPPAEICKCF